MEEIHMRQCPKCGTPIEEGSTFCTTCGLKIEPQPAEAPKPQNNAYNPNFGAAPNMGAGNPNPVYQQPPYAPQPPMPPADPYDHTAEFDAKDISENKVIAMLLYLMSFVGIVIALLSQNKSEYVAFHLRQALKFLVVETLLGILTAVFCWTFIIPIAGAIMLVVLTVIKVICFFQICKGQAKEPAIIRSLDFLK